MVNRIVGALFWLAASSIPCLAGDPPPGAFRVATFNVEDLGTADLLDPNQARVTRIADVIRRIAPDILLVNEIAFDGAGAPGKPDGEASGMNGSRLAARLSGRGEPGTLSMRAFMAPVNTGCHSEHDLDNDGTVDPSWQAPGPSGPDGAPAPQTVAGRRYGNDCWGFGTYPGQYGMALLVQDRHTILESEIRTFQRFAWRAMPDAMLPTDPGTGEPWYSPQELANLPLSSKSFWDVPVRLESGEVVHVICSHPTPPAFDGPEGRNKQRNHDEIRLIRDYVEGAAYLVDDQGRAGGLEPGALFVILGDLNADPDEGSAIANPMVALLASKRLGPDPSPRSPIQVDGLDADDTSSFRLRVDYVLPGRGLQVVACGVERPTPDARHPSDHFPVWADMVVRGQAPETRPEP